VSSLKHYIHIANLCLFRQQAFTFLYYVTRLLHLDWQHHSPYLCFNWNTPNSCRELRRSDYNRHTLLTWFSNTSSLALASRIITARVLKARACPFPKQRFSRPLINLPISLLFGISCAKWEGSGRDVAVGDLVFGGARSVPGWIAEVFVLVTNRLMGHVYVCTFTAGLGMPAEKAAKTRMLGMK
jgi:hypothetical protein